MKKQSSKKPKKETEKSKQARLGKKFRKVMEAKNNTQCIEFFPSNMEIHKQVARWEREYFYDELLLWGLYIFCSIIAGLYIGLLLVILL